MVALLRLAPVVLMSPVQLARNVVIILGRLLVHLPCIMAMLATSRALVIPPYLLARLRVICRALLRRLVVAIQGRGRIVTVLLAPVTRVAILAVLSQHLTAMLPLGLTLPVPRRQCSMHLGAAFPLADRTAWFVRLVTDRTALLFPLIIHSMFSAPMVIVRTLFLAPRHRAVVRPVGTVVTLSLFPTSSGMTLLVVLQSRRLQLTEVALLLLTSSRPIRFTAAGFPRLVTCKVLAADSLPVLLSEVVLEMVLLEVVSEVAELDVVLL